MIIITGDEDSYDFSNG